MVEVREIKGIRSLLRSMQSDKVKTAGGKVFGKEVKISDILREYNKKRGELSQELISEIDKIDRTAFSKCIKNGKLKNYHTLRNIFVAIDNLNEEYDSI